MSSSPPSIYPPHKSRQRNVKIWTNTSVLFQDVQNNMNDSFGRTVFGREGHGVILIYSRKCFLDGLKCELCNMAEQLLLRTFAFIFMRDIGLYFSFHVMSLSCFGIRVILASENEVGRFPSSSTIWENL